MTCGQWSREIRQPNGKIQAERRSFGGAGTRPRKEKKQNEPNLYQPVLNQRVVKVFPEGEAAGSATSRRSPHRDRRGPRAKSRPGPRKQQQGNNALCRQRPPGGGTRRVTKMTKRTKYLITTMRYSDLRSYGEARKGLVHEGGRQPQDQFREERDQQERGDVGDEKGCRAAKNRSDRKLRNRRANVEAVPDGRGASAHR